VHGTARRGVCVHPEVGNVRLVRGISPESQPATHNPYLEEKLMNLSRKSMLGTLALVATLSTPLAFAQAQTGTTPTDASAQTSTPTDPAMQSQTPPATYNDAAGATGSPVKKSWADVDMNKDGNLTKAEAAAVPALGQAFDKADANGDGSLTPEEYKAYTKVKGKK
jgi:hypothetical protein